MALTILLGQYSRYFIANGGFSSADHALSNFNGIIRAEENRAQSEGLYALNKTNNLIISINKNDIYLEAHKEHVDRLAAGNYKGLVSGKGASIEQPNHSS